MTDPPKPLACRLKINRKGSILLRHVLLCGVFSHRHAICLHKTAHTENRQSVSMLVKLQPGCTITHDHDRLEFGEQGQGIWQPDYNLMQPYNNTISMSNPMHSLCYQHAVRGEHSSWKLKMGDSLQSLQPDGNDSSCSAASLPTFSAPVSTQIKHHMGQGTVGICRL